MKELKLEIARPCRKCNGLGGYPLCPECHNKLFEQDVPAKPNPPEIILELRSPESNPPLNTGRILVWIKGGGPAIVNVEERWMCYWNGVEDGNPTCPSEWEWWCEIPNVIPMAGGGR